VLRLLEVGLFLLPFAAFLLWRAGALSGAPSPAQLVVAAVLLVVMAAALAWLSTDDTLRPGQRYVPAQLQDGRIVPGHAAGR
jgi:hypothetical protein